MIERTIYKEILKTVRNKAVTVITGARQVGKTTLCGLIQRDMGFGYVSLANVLDRQAAKRDPMAFLSLHPAPCIIDEIQKAPELFEYLEGVVDGLIKQGRKRSLYVLTGSQAYKLMKGVTESMSGRVGLISMEPLSLSEINRVEETPFAVDIARVSKRCAAYTIETLDLYDHIVRGFYPELYDNPGLETAPFYADYLATYLEKDVSDFIELRNKQKFVDLMTILASLTGQELIYDNLAKSVGVDVKTAQSWVSVLIAGNIIHLLQPYNEESVTKRVVRRPKVYFSDTGLACYLARVGSRDTLIHSYLKGAMVETYIINEIIKSYKNNRKDAEASFHYFRTFDQKEIDLLILSEGRLTLVECKSGEEFRKKDIVSFDLLKGTRYQLGKNAVVCTTRTIYPIREDAYAFPVTAI